MNSEDNVNCRASLDEQENDRMTEMTEEQEREREDEALRQVCLMLASDREGFDALEELFECDDFMTKLKEILGNEPNRLGGYVDRERSGRITDSVEELRLIAEEYLLDTRWIGISADAYY